MGFWNWLLGTKKKSEEYFQTLLEEIDSLTRPQDIPRRIIIASKCNILNK